MYICLKSDMSFFTAHNVTIGAETLNKPSWAYKESHVICMTNNECVHEKTKKEVIQLKTPIALKLGTNVRFSE